MKDLEIEESMSDRMHDQSSMSFSKDTMTAMLKAAMVSGDITSLQAKQMRQNAGISQAVFTKKRLSKAKIKQKRKAQKLARRAQRGK